jgi:hypothetical protein
MTRRTPAGSGPTGVSPTCGLTLVQRHRGAKGVAPVVSATWAKVPLTLVGLCGFAGTVALATGSEALDYRGGSLLSALSVAAIVLGAVCVARRPIATVLSLRPLVWIGTVSYLWHFPVFIELDAGRVGLTGVALVTARFATTLVLASLGYYLVDRPIMEGALWRTLKAAWPTALATGATVVVIVAGTVMPAAAATAVNVSSVRRIPSAERQALQAAHAFTTRPVRFMFVGDSLSVTMGVGLEVDTVHRWGVDVINKGKLGCDLDDLPTISTTNGQEDLPDQSVSDCSHWETLWSGEIDATRPEVVGVLMGRWDILNHIDGNRLVHIGEPAWDVHLTDELDHVVAVLSAHGAKVVLFTMPYIDPSNETLNGTLSPYDSPTRVDEWNHILDEVAAHHRGVVTVIDLNRILDPHGHFQTDVDRVVVRWPDGIHISKQGGEWLQPRVLPTIAQLGLDARASMQKRSTQTPDSEKGKARAVVRGT